MKLALTFLSLLLAHSLYSEMRVTGHLTGAPKGTVLIFNVPFDCWYYAANSMEVRTDDHGRFSVLLPVKRAQTVFLDYKGERFFLYAEPGKMLTINAIAEKFSKTIQFSGSLKNENNIRVNLGLTFKQLGQKSWNDSLSDPRDILNQIQINQNEATGLLKNNPLKTSSAFRQMTRSDIDFFAISKLWDLIWSNGVWTARTTSAYDREAWRNVLISAQKAVVLSDSNAINSYHYQQMITYYPRYLQHQAANTEEFAAIIERIFKKPFTEFEKEVRLKGKRFWEFSALKHGFQGPALEYAMASFLTQGIFLGDLEYEQEAYDEFKKEFPDSKYSAYIDGIMQHYLQSISKAASDIPGITFKQDLQQLKNLDSILKPHRGKIVYIDLWGTWCGPCRQEFAFNKAVREHFEGRAIDFVYVAVEHAANPQKKWKEVVAFYDLKGEHILAGADLRSAFEKLYNDGDRLVFPSYILADKNGKIVNINAGRPSEKALLYQQIEALNDEK